MRASFRTWPVRLLAALLLMLATGHSASSESRVALVIGNSAYKNTAPLTNPLNDAKDVAAALERTGFEVIVAVDAEKRQMDSALRAFAEKLGQADVALFYYAGHGLQVGSENFLVPIDAKLANQRDLEFEAVKLNFVLRQMEIDRDGKTTIVMLDACRDNPLSRGLARTMGTRSTAVGQGLAPASTGVGTFIAYATQPGNVALDGDGRNSPFTSALLKNVGQKGRNLNATMIEVRKAVIQSTGGKQVPWDHSALTGDFYFVPGDAVQGSQAPAPSAKSDDVDALKARLKALEEAEQKRQASAAGRTGVSLMPPELMSRIAETRARLAVAEDQAKELQRKLLEARRIEGQARDPAERQRLMQESIRIQGDMTRASLTAKRLKEEIAKLLPQQPAQPAAAGPAASASIDLVPEQAIRGFDVYAAAALSGEKIKASAADSVGSCITVCLNTPGCIAGEYEASASDRNQCNVYKSVTRVMASPGGPSTFVKPAQPKAASAPGVAPACQPISLTFSDPIPLTEGLKLCNGIGQHEARVERIGERGVSFAVSGGIDFTCTPDRVCQFDWPGNPSPVFRVEIQGGDGGRPVQARMVPRR